MTLVRIQATESLPMEAVDVELPIYRKHDVTPDEVCYTTIIYSQVTVSLDPRFGGFVELSVSETVDGGEARYGVEFEAFHFGRSQRDYDLGLGWYKSSAAEFRDAFIRLQNFLTRESPATNMPKSLWTQDMPTKAGHYWHICPPGVDVECVEVVLEGVCVCYAAVDWGSPTPISPGGWWMRIEQPAPPEVRP